VRIVAFLNAAVLFRGNRGWCLLDHCEEAIAGTIRTACGSDAYDPINSKRCLAAAQACHLLPPKSSILPSMPSARRECSPARHTNRSIWSPFYILETANPPRGGGAKPWVCRLRIASAVDRQVTERMVSMFGLRRFLCQFLSQEDGPTAVEYAVMLALIIAVCIGAVTSLGSTTNQTFTSVGSAVNVSSS